MECVEVYRYLIEELDEHLDEPSRIMIRDHLSGCGNCASTLDSLKKTVSLYKSQPELLVSSSLIPRVLEEIRKNHPPHPPKKP